jgi:hypothetical protein
MTLGARDRHSSRKSLRLQTHSTFARNDLLFTMSDNTRTQNVLVDVKSLARIHFHGRVSKAKPVGIAAGGARRDRTDDLLLAKQALSQLSYGPKLAQPYLACRAEARGQPSLAFRERRLVGLGRFELPTSRLSSARSNQLSYRPRTHTLDPRPKIVAGKRMLQRRMDCVGSSEKKEKRRRRSPANGHANPETDMA